MNTGRTSSHVWGPPIPERCTTRASAPCVLLSLSLSRLLVLPVYDLSVSLSLSLSATDYLVLHSAASLIVHTRLDARNGVACPAINGTLRFSIGHLPDRTNIFIRESEPADWIGRGDWFAHVYVCMQHSEGLCY